MHTDINFHLLADFPEMTKLDDDPMKSFEIEMTQNCFGEFVDRCIDCQDELHMPCNKVILFYSSKFKGNCYNGSSETMLDI